VASWLVCSSPDRVVRVQALAGDIVLCSWARHFTLTVPLSTQVYKWVRVSLMLSCESAVAVGGCWLEIQHTWHLVTASLMSLFMVGQ